MTSRLSSFLPVLPRLITSMHSMQIMTLAECNLYVYATTEKMMKTRLAGDSMNQGGSKPKLGTGVKGKTAFEQE